MSSTGRGTKREILDFYWTPGWTTDAILDVLVPRYFPFPPRVLEPAAGEGHIIERLLARGMPASRITACELHAGRAVVCRDRTGVHTVRADFVSGFEGDAGGYELIITNPPFAQAEAFLRTALTLTAPGGVVALLLRLNWLGSGKRAMLHRQHPADIYVLPRRPMFGGQTQTDSCEYAWFVWGTGGGRWSILQCA